MKVSWHAHAATTHPTHPLPPTHKGDRPFAGLLKSTGGSIAPPQDQEEKTQQALGFGELGVFGRFGAQSSPMPPPSAPGSVADAGPGFEQDVEVPQMPAGLPPFLPSGDGTMAMAATAPDGELPQAPADLPSGEIATGEISGAGQAGPYSPDTIAMPEEDAPTEGSGIVRPPLRPSPNANSGANPSVSLQLSEENGELSVIARSNDPDKSYCDVRQMVEEAAAEFGKKLSEFHLNGTAQQSFTSALGGPHGSRTR